MLFTFRIQYIKFLFFRNQFVLILLVRGFMAEIATSAVKNNLSYLTSKDLLGLKRQVLKY